ncbi:S8 family serine peptidase [Tessaracoccus palaemonis]|uniref:S8 family serine peptidase n=1 Tax=Tessaracoccus palaemonis TaxID=2829499 RepID=A0ABX8SIB5_9ACTN|nr:S8 family serine peptidase [Tessaracoccus palaemonis]QXT63127.1 S8 family serine peptidase [Tessaracoccus palaemonis]
MQWMRSGVAAAVAVLLTCVLPAAPALADDDLVPLDQGLCRTAQPTPAADLVNAWQLQRLDMESVWELATGRGVRVAVIDTGVASDDSGYWSRTRITTYDLLSGEGTDDDGRYDCDHGTAVASLLAAGHAEDGSAVNEATNFAGISPGATVLAYRALRWSTPQDDLPDDEQDDLSATVRAVRQAIADGADVINLSQVVGASSPGLADYRAAIADAIEAGIVVVAAAGNADQAAAIGGEAYPASLPGVISVGASDAADAGDQLTYPSDTVAVGAPGRGLLALAPSSGDDSSDQAFTGDATGTSFATALVSGVVALMIQYERDVHGATLTPAEVRARLIATADPPASSVPDPLIGHGIVNPLRALTGATPASLTPTEPGASAEAVITPEQREDRTLPVAALLVAGGALALVLLGVVAAVTIPRATRHG